MNIALISFTRRGGMLAGTIKQEICHRNMQMDTVDHYAYEKYPMAQAVPFSKGADLTDDIFNKYDALIFVSAAQIAVRLIAPHISTKRSDPAVLSIDESAGFVVSLLSGHMGGANALTKQIADMIEAVPVITTATDTGGRFSPDSFAKANHLYIGDMETAKHIAAAVLEGETLGLYSEYPCKHIPDEFTGGSHHFGICITKDASCSPFARTLTLIPQDIVLGVGCRKHTDADAFEHFVLEQLDKNNISLFRIRYLCTIDLKKEEESIVSFTKKYNIPLLTYDTEELKKVQGDISSSTFVEQITGVDNVCERSALTHGGTLIVKKQTGHGITFAACRLDMDIDFQRSLL